LSGRLPWRWLVPLVLGLVVADVAFEVNVPMRAEVTIETPKLARGQSLRVLHLSDVHNKAFPDGNQQLFRLIREAAADCVVITGDLIDAKTRELDYIQSFVARLKPPVYYVTGNHEWWNPERKSLVAALEAAGVTVVNNGHAVFRKAGLSVNMCGVDDAYTHHDELDKAVAGVDPRLLTILISHSPAPGRRLAGTPVDVMLAGHTHGGQVRIPFVGALMAPGEGWFPHFDKGVFDLGEGKQLYIDSGLGTSTLPLRFLNRSQFSLVTIQGPL
jgi:predicted MPP superfamily phosphohydrolase